MYTREQLTQARVNLVAVYGNGEFVPVLDLIDSHLKALDKIEQLRATVILATDALNAAKEVIAQVGGGGDF